MRTLLLIIIAIIALVFGGCATMPFRFGLEYTTPDGQKIGTSFALDPSFAKQKK